MKVTLLAHTYFCSNYTDLFEGIGWEPKGWGTDGYVFEDMDEDPDALAEFAGRACYQSWGRPNPKTATNEGYLANILGMGHESVLEHASATFYIEGVSRSLTHELIRHRHLSFSQLSQRYVDESDTEFVKPPLMEELGPDATGYNDRGCNGVGLWFLEETAREEYQREVDAIMQRAKELGRKVTRKQAREAARAVLPNATETKIVVTGNMRAWRDVLKKRWHVAADAEIRQLAGEILKQLRSIAPNSLLDIPDEPYGSE